MKFYSIIAAAALFTALLSSGSQAAPYSAKRTLGPPQTLSHCGLVPTANKIYTTHPRNIRIIQRKLIQLGYNIGPRGIDGVYGRDTKRAIRHFQKDMGALIDSRVGPETSMLLAYASHPLPNVQRCKQPYRMVTR